MPFSLLFLATIISLSDSTAWKIISFEKVKSNEITFNEAGLRIEVEESASPLLYLFPERKQVRNLRVTGRVSGGWKFAAGDSWKDGPDDALLRFGLIENGTKRLNALERIAAPDWIKELESRASTTADGIGRIHCFHVMPGRQWIGETRKNPNVSIFEETISAAPEDDGRFELSVVLDTPMETVGLWLLADGDDSEASFIVEIENIEIGLAP
ncbi:MAG: hypothetical protein P1U58_09515 [Verrucomicrobiales bacterium]|nr:hypothetical protein [Verrucomicrobiales bacterium]